MVVVVVPCGGGGGGGCGGGGGDALWWWWISKRLVRLVLSWQLILVASELLLESHHSVNALHAAA